MVILFVLLGVIILLAAVVLVRTFMFKPPTGAKNIQPYNPGEVPADVLERFSQAIQIPTVSAQYYKDTNFAPFDEYNEFIQKAYPLFHQNTSRTIINEYAMVYCWKGKDPSLEPFLLTAHYDVVPVESGTEDEWKYPGFSGKIAEGRIWGRGTLDIKSQMTAQMEAAEALMKSGFTPQRDFYFVYGHDEEAGGLEGAFKVAEHFKQSGLHFEGVLDEGGIAITDMLKGVDAPLALIGVAEKGFGDVNVYVPGGGGHSSMPPKHTALGKLAAYICKVENSPMPATLPGPTLEMLRNISGEMGFAVRMAVANLWLFKPLLLKILASMPETNGLIRTTFAPTMASASKAANVLPQRAHGTVNVRILPGDTVESVTEYFKGLAEGTDIKIEVGVPRDPSPVSPTDSYTYAQIEKQIDRLFPGVITTPYLVMGGTDARKYHLVCDNVYRFTPMLITSDEKDCMHSTNESVTIENYGRMIYFYEQFIKDFDEK